MRLSIYSLFTLFAISFSVVGQNSFQVAPRSIGPAGMSGRITAIVVNPNDKDIWYIGTASGGLWKTINAGTTFEPIFDQQPLQSIGAVAVAPSNPDVIYAGTGEGNPRNTQTSGKGVFKSLDGGMSWQFIGLPESRNIHRIIIHPTDENTVWVGALGDPFAANQSRGVYKSTDGGRHWEKVLYINDRTGIADMIIHPEHPNQLWAAMWEFRRSPWDSYSGGEGSGIYRSNDGGDTWQELSQPNGLPEKPYGRIGLAIAQSQPETMYALVESKKNGLYKSTDGGQNWSLINTETIGSRPFYFADIYVDPNNENRVYNLYSRLARSENGGRSFEIIEDWGFEVHADHHAFWIDPDDSDFMIDGTDGGLYWTKDRGENWRFAENLPLGQFYHVTIDNNVPYNLYGGLQDNGTWYGPSEVWNRTGIRNSFWRELAFNDGFDVALDPANENIGYALWQGGMLVRFDKSTGQRKTIRPWIAEDTLRFNWNAALAIDPKTAGVVYLGSQYVHRSIEYGETWETISPDLTTDNPEKQQQLTSGGLSIDATTAENHTTITVISPALKDSQKLWVGTDDGRVWLRHAIENDWQELTGNIKGMPNNGWVQQIVPSPHSDEAAFVVIDNHRMGDWSPYVFYTEDNGQTWRNIAAGKGIESYCLSIVQDPFVSDLLFLGTEFGLYYSLNFGENWQKWTEGYPAVSTMDLKIHPEERDLVMATFGRSMWIIDDLRPWEALAKNPELTKKTLHLFELAPTIQPIIDQAPGQRLMPDHLYAGDNNAREVIINYWINDSKVDSVQISVKQGENTIHSWKEPVRQGLNRTSWDLQWTGKPIYGPLMSPVLEKPLAMPGDYLVLISNGEQMVESALVIKPDPRIKYKPDDYRAQLEFRLALDSLSSQLDDIKKKLQQMEKLMSSLDHIDEPFKGRIQQSIDDVWAMITYRDIQGAISDAPRFDYLLGKAYYYTHSPYESLSKNDIDVLRDLRSRYQSIQTKFEALRQGPWQQLKSNLKEKGFSVFDLNE